MLWSLLIRYQMSFIYKIEGIITMTKTLCLFSSSCTPYGHLYEGCLFYMERQVRKKGFLAVSCSTWNKVYETDKERRLRYAQETERRRALSGNEGQAGAIAVGEGYKGLETTPEKEIGGNVDYVAL